MWLIGEYGENAIEKYWGVKNAICAFGITSGSDKKVWIKCQDDEKHGEYQVTCSHLKEGTRCPICVGKKVVAGINDILTLRPKLNKIVVDMDIAKSSSICSERKIRTKCDFCGYESKSTAKTLAQNGFSCKQCGDGISYPEKIMANLLSSIGIDFEREYQPEWAIDESGSQRRYDFYIPSKKLIIEMDGGWHNKDNLMTGQTAEESKSIDKFKDAMATNNGMDVIRIDSGVSDVEYLKENIINSRISTIFNIENVNWTYIDKKSLKSSMVIACEMWNEGVRDIQTIANTLKINYVTARRYLKKCGEMCMCDFSIDELILKRRKNASNAAIMARSKKVMICETGDIFSSLSEMERESEVLIGSKLSASKACAVINGKRNHHKGYTFKYVD